ncbi:unnamed protein product [Strongylus vulgaris]|uniref:Uncharacterized protein n=1 Tax=Strongylus vulgaris TaxID=40348 RepID=A0A3P7L8V0_STRVU|nr:unnamed protein product [Strongylus vulgaris]
MVVYWMSQRYHALAVVSIFSFEVRFRKKLKKKIATVVEEGEKSYTTTSGWGLLATCDWPIEKDPAKDYELLLGNLRACGDSTCPEQGTKEYRKPKRTC